MKNKTHSYYARMLNRVRRFEATQYRIRELKHLVKASQRKYQLEQDEQERINRENYEKRNK